MPAARRRASTLVLAAALIVLTPSFAACAGAGDATAPIDVRIIAFNDLHGNLEPPSGSSGRVTLPDGRTVDAGGAAFMATHVNQLRAAAAGGSLLLSTGDNIGASPLVSALFHDEPTIDFENQIGVVASAAGNHEFDEGYPELQRIEHGGCHPTDGCRFRSSFGGASFPILSANVSRTDGGQAFAPYTVANAGGVQIGVIGATLRELPTLVPASALEGLQIGDEVEAINRTSKLLDDTGVHVQVVLVHEGDEGSNTCSPGPAMAIARATSPAVDVIFSAHTHQQYVCMVPDPAGVLRPLVQGLSFGRLLSVVDMRIDPGTHEVIRADTRADNVVVTRDVPPDPSSAALVEEARMKAASIANQPVGRITADLTRTEAPSGESPLGSIVADAQLAATRSAGAVVAMTNSDGIRADLLFASSRAGEGDGVVTYGEAYAVQPFGDVLQTVTLTGGQLKEALEQQFTVKQPLQVSDSLHYTVSASAPAGSKVSGLTISGARVDPTTQVRVTLNNFLAGGGDGFTALAAGRDVVGGAVDTDAFVQYLRAALTLAPPPPGGITEAP